MKTSKSKMLLSALALLVALTGLTVGPLASPAQASETCSIPVGSGAVTPSGGNTVALGTVTQAVAQWSCISLDLGVYAAALRAQIVYADGSQCGYGVVSQPAILGQNSFTMPVGCNTPYYDSRVNMLQTLQIWGQTSTGFYTPVYSYPIV